MKKLLAYLIIYPLIILNAFFIFQIVVNVIDVMLSVEIHNFLFPPNYFVYTHRKGWIHCSEITEQDEKEITGFTIGL